MAHISTNTNIPSTNGIKWVELSFKQYLTYISGGFDALRRLIK